MNNMVEYSTDSMNLFEVRGEGDLCQLISFATSLLTALSIIISSSFLPVYDKTVLVIPKPGMKLSLTYQSQKVFQPFTSNLWVAVLAIIVSAALLSVWFSDREMVAKKRNGRTFTHRKKKWMKRKRAYLRLFLDAFLEKGMFFFSAGIEQDTGASLPHKVLMFGFGFFILIAVSAYVANLAAFLTQSGLETSFRSMKEVIDKNVPICCHSALVGEIRMRWPKANWISPTGGYVGMVEAYARGECKALAIGREDTMMNIDFLARLCKHGLVYTDIFIHETPIAFPIRPELASGFSYWMLTAEKSYGVSVESTKQAFIENNPAFKAECEVELSNLGMEEADDFTQVESINMILPIIIFVICAFIAVVMQLMHESKKKKGQTSYLIGRQSTLNIYQSRRQNLDDVDEETNVQRKGSCGLDEQVDEGGSGMPRSKSGDEFVSCISEDEFYENGAPQSTPGPKSIFGGLSEDMDMINEDDDEAVKRGKEISHRIEELVESGAIEDVLDCFDTFQELKKLKKLKKVQ